MNYASLIEIRHYLHQNPEISGQEHQTSAFIAEQLALLSPAQLIAPIGGTGVAAVFGKGHSGPTILFRAELDALPIEETNKDLPYHSQNPGVSHKCGHDGHMAILLGFAQKVAQQPPAKGRIVVLFQPAEENGQGAKAVIEDPRFTEIQPDYAFAIHNLPGWPLGQFVLKEGNITAAVKSILIQFKGKEAHAAEPENGLNPTLAIGAVIQLFAQMNQPAVDSPNFFLMTPVYINMGQKAYGISAGAGEIHFTIRAWEQRVMDHQVQIFVKRIEAIANQNHMKLSIEWTDAFKANINHPQAIEYLLKVCHQQGLNYIKKNMPLKWGEDFGYFTQNIPGAFIGLGAGVNSPALHHSDYDFPDELLNFGVNLFIGLVDEILS